jgi:hypothetical protein
MYSVLKRIFVGRPLPSSEQEHQRLSKKIALAALGYLVPMVTSLPYHLKTGRQRSASGAEATRSRDG